MLITKDMLVQKGIAQNIVDDFEKKYPTGFDLATPHDCFYVGSYGNILWETDLAALFSYTGISINTAYAGVKSILNYSNGYLEDLQNGKPARAAYYSNNKLRMVAFYKHGVICNPSPKLPARIYWHENGNMEERTFLKNGVLDDPYPGVPAYVIYHENGVAMRVMYFTDDKLTSDTWYDENGKVC